MGRVTLRDIAERCGTSLHTVSKILGGSDLAFAANTRESVHAMAKELGYLPNASARAARAGRFAQAGLVLGIGEAGANLPSAALSGMIDVFSSHGMGLCVTRAPADLVAAPDSVRGLLARLMADGVIINWHYHIPQLMRDLLAKNAIPAVWLNVREDENCIYPDDRAGGETLTGYHLECGHTRIAYVDWTHRPADDHYSIKDRRSGYEIAMRRAGLQPRVIAGYYGFDQRPGVARALLSGEDRPTAIIGYAHQEIAQLRLVAAELGITDQQLALAAFEDEGAWVLDDVPAKMLIPWYSLGGAAAELLSQKLGQPGRQPSRAIPMVFSPGRSSTAR